jgi:hypothetical protein
VESLGAAKVDGPQPPWLQGDAVDECHRPLEPLCQEEVGGLDVTVDHVVLVAGCDNLQALPQHHGGLPFAERPVLLGDRWAHAQEEDNKFQRGTSTTDTPTSTPELPDERQPKGLQKLGNKKAGSSPSYAR